jgi:hypothetical protein
MAKTALFWVRILIKENFQNIIEFYEHQEGNVDPNLAIGTGDLKVINDLKQARMTLESKRNKIADNIRSLEERRKLVAVNPKNKYHLKGVIIHEGTVSYGHYYSYVNVNGKWFKFDDLQVTEVDMEEVMNTGRGLTEKKSANCYCLVYLKGEAYH